MMKNFYDAMKSLKKVLLIAGFLWLSAFNLAQAQKTYTISGKVVDNQGETMPGVTVLIKGTAIGTSTDIDGAFNLSAPNQEVTLVFSFIGAVPKEVKATAGTPVNVVMESKSVGLSELVVVGYGVQKKSVVTGAISSVKASDLQSKEIPRLEQALQGRTSGLTIASSSGQPGSGSTVRVRGITSMGDSEPLYVVDGLPVDVGGISYLNPADIESIEVLKDAATAAIYGTRAASGVILVTTKKGKAGKLQVHYNAYIGTQAPAKKLDLLNATEYATLQNEYATNAGKVAPYANPASLGTGTDWQSAIFNNSAVIQNHELSLSGGNDRSTFYSSFGYLDQEGIVSTSISNYNRLNIRINSNHKIRKWLVVGENLGYSHEKSKGLGNTNSEYGGPLASAINLDPITPLIITDPEVANSAPYSTKPVVKDGEGRPYGISSIVMQEMTNPKAYEQTKQGNYGWADNFVGDAFVEIQPIKGLKIKSDIGTKLAFYGNTSFSPVVYLNASTSTGINSLYWESDRGFRYNFENTITYNKKVGQHNFTGLVGTSAFLEHEKKQGFTLQNLPVNTFAEASMNFPSTPEQRDGWAYEGADHKVSSLFARLTYDYNEKYLFTGIVRRDGSSRFGSNNKFAMFPSVSAGWVASRESFWPENKLVNSLKIRGSYGVTGNDNIGDFKYVSTVSGGYNYTFGDDIYTIGYAPSALANPDLKWEQTSQSNIGFEATLYEYFTLVFDLYNKNTTGMLQRLIVPEYVGVEGPIGNVASMTNKGVEVELGFHKQLGEFDVKFSGNTSYLKNEVTDLGSVEYLESMGLQSSDYSLERNEVGHSYNAFYGFQSLGVFAKQSEILGYKDANGNVIQPNAKPGDLKFADINGDGKITVDDRTFLGNSIPSWSYGFSASASYHGFDLQVFGQGVAGNKIFNGLRRLDIASANWTTDALNRWTPTNPYTDFPRLVDGDPNKNFSRPSNFYLSNGAYFRIKIVQLGYTIPQSVLSRVGIEQVRVYINANNLFTVTKYTGYDPEIGGGSYGVDRGIYPQARSFLAGLNLTF